MANSLWRGTVKHSPAAAGGYGYPDRPQPLHGSNTCRFGSKRPVANPPLRASSRLFCSASSSTVVGAKRALPAPSPPSDLKASPVPLLLVPQILLDKNEYELGNDVNDDRYVFYSLPEKKILTVEKNRIGDDARWIGSSKGWIMYMSRRDCNLYLYNPFSSSFVALPSIETLPNVTGGHYLSSETDETYGSRSQSKNYESILSYREPDFKFIMRSWHLCSYEELNMHLRKWPIELPRGIRPVMAPPEDLVNRGFISKMAISSDPTFPSNSYVAIIYGTTDKLAICRVGDERWTLVEGYHYKQIFFSRHDNSELFVSGWITSTNFGRLSMKKLPRNKTGGSKHKIISPEWDFIPEMKFEKGFRVVSLVESATKVDQFLLVRSLTRNNVMDVHKVNLSDAKKEWVRVESLGDQALFVEKYCETLAVPATQLPAQVKPNCIYFTDFESGQVGVFKLEKRGEDFEAFNDGICLDLSLRSKNSQLSHVWMERFRKIAEGWAVWVVPNIR